MASLSFPVDSMTEPRAQWKSKMGFILAASGSAIGLGNIVMFSSNAYRYGGGAFYLPYFIALFLVGIPVMIAEFGLGAYTKKSFPMAMRQAGGRVGEFAGWFAILNAGLITMFYVTILGWVVGMLFRAIAMEDVSQGFAPGNNVWADLIRGWLPVGAVAIVWLLNILLVSKGTKTIELAVKIFVPLMWVAMVVLVVVGFFLPGGFDGMQNLFTPEPSVLVNPDVWRGATSQMFFTLSLGFGVMTAYASYLPDRSDHSHNAITTSLLNCGFEWIAGVAVFAMLFAYSQLPASGTLGMMFTVVPSGIAALPFAVKIFGIAFFSLLLIAGLTSSISLVEALVASLQDKFRMPRGRTLAICAVVGFLGSALFALPMVVQIPNGSATPDSAPIGLMLLDFMDHWAFGYGLIIVGLIECLVIGWGIGAGNLRKFINQRSRFQLGVWFEVLLKFVLPLLLTLLLTVSIMDQDIIPKKVYGTGITTAHGSGLLNALVEWSPKIILCVWIFGCGLGAWLLSRAPAEDQDEGAVDEEVSEIWEEGGLQ